MGPTTAAISWLMFIETHVPAIVGVLVALGTALGVSMKYGKRIIKWWKTRAYHNRMLAEKLIPMASRWESIEQLIHERVLPSMERIEHELRNNSGGSLRDRIDRIDRLVVRHSSRMNFESNRDRTGVYEAEVNGDWNYVNQALCEMFDKHPTELLGRGWLTSVAEHDREEVWKKWTYALQQDIPYECSFQLASKESGESFVVRVIAQPYRTASNTVIGYYGTIERIRPLE